MKRESRGEGMLATIFFLIAMLFVPETVFSESEPQLFLKPISLPLSLHFQTREVRRRSFLQGDFSWLEEDIRIDTLPYVHDLFHYLAVKKPELGRLGFSGEMYVAWMTRPVTMPNFDVWTEGVYEFRNGRDQEREVSQFWIQPSRLPWFRIGTQIELDGSYFVGFFVQKPSR